MNYYCKTKHRKIINPLCYEKNKGEFYFKNNYKEIQAFPYKDNYKLQIKTFLGDKEWENCSIICADKEDALNKFKHFANTINKTLL